MPLNVDQQARYIEIWSKAVETQMHFNEMSVKSRQLGLTFVAASLGVAVVLITRGTDYVIKVPFSDPWFHVHVSVILIIASALALWAVRSLDLNVYHRMLRGAVTFGEDFEENYMKQIFELEKGMTQAISHFSRHHDAQKETPTGSSKYHYTGRSQISAEDKIKTFYRTAFLFLWISAGGVFLITNLEIWINNYSSIESAPKSGGLSTGNDKAGSGKPNNSAPVAVTPAANDKSQGTTSPASNELQRTKSDTIGSQTGTTPTVAPDTAKSASPLPSSNPPTTAAPSNAPAGQTDGPGAPK